MNPLIRRFDAADEYYFEEGCYIHELSNSPDDPLMSVARARLPLGGQTRWHRLHNVVERSNFGQIYGSSVPGPCHFFSACFKTL